MTKQNIQILGTTHLDSSESIIKSIQDFRPNIIGVELCKTRLQLMVINPVLNQVATEQLEGHGLIDKISKAIKEKAEKESIQYGSDQITASRYALDKNIPLVCLDKDIYDIKRLMELLPSNETQGFLTELANFEQKTLGEQTKDINENEVIETLKSKYPVAYEFLIDSRDMFIAFNILKTIHENPGKRIIIFLGKGHVKKIKELLNNHFTQEDLYNMSKIINIQDIPKEEVVYARKDFTGWRIVQPIIDPITKKFIWKNFLSIKGFITLGFILLLLGVCYLAFKEQLANYHEVVSNPCKYCMELTSSHSNTLNLSLPSLP